MSVTEFNTKILEAFVIERKVSFLLMVKYPVRNVCTNYKLKTVQNKFVKEISFQKIGLWMYCHGIALMILGIMMAHFISKKQVSKWLLRLYYVLTIIEKLCRWILPMKIESCIWLMIELKCNERFQNWMLVQLVTQAWMGDFFLTTA